MRFIILSFLCGALAAPTVLRRPANTTETVTYAEIHSGLLARTISDITSPSLILSSRAGEDSCLVEGSPIECTVQPISKHGLDAVKRGSTRKKKPTSVAKSSGNRRLVHSKGKTILTKTPKSSKVSGKDSLSGHMPYVIWPKKGASTASQETFTAKLKSTTGKLMLSPTPSLDGDGFMFWRAILTQEEVNQLKKDSVVGTVELDPVEYLDSEQGQSKPTKGVKSTKNTNKHTKTSNREAGRTASKPLEGTKSTNARTQKRSRVLINQANNGAETHSMQRAPWELAELSKDPWDMSGGQTAYRYHKSGGQGVMIYGIDSGLNQSHDWVKQWLDTTPFLGGRKPQLHWIHTTSDPRERDVDDDDSNAGRGHGSCVWSKAVGMQSAAPFADYTAVKLDKSPHFAPDVKGNLHHVGYRVTQGTAVDAFVLTYLDILKRKQAVGGNLVNAAPSIINFSMGGPRLALRTSPELYLKMFDVLIRLGHIGVPVFKPVSNGFGRPISIEEDWYMTFREQRLNNFFTVASVGKDGRYSAFTSVNGPGQNLIDFNAPGEDLQCIGSMGRNTVRRDAKGNSYASPLVASLAAYAMGLPNGLRTPLEVHAWLTGYAKQRDQHPNALYVIANQYAKGWNGH